MTASANPPAFQVRDVRTAHISSRTWWLYAGDEDETRVGVAYSKEAADLFAAAPDLLAALIALRDAVKDQPTMQGREYVSLGIQVNNAIAKAEGRSE